MEPFAARVCAGSADAAGAPLASGAGPALHSARGSRHARQPHRRGFNAAMAPRVPSREGASPEARARRRAARVAAHVACSTTGGDASLGRSRRATLERLVQGAALPDDRAPTSDAVLLGVTPWRHVTQERVDAFADATDDPQFIHRADAVERGSPLPWPIAHGYLTLCLLTRDAGELAPMPDVAYNLNYGVDHVRFLRPVPVGARIRAAVSLIGATLLPCNAQGKYPAKLRFALRCEVEGRDAEGPAMVAETLGHPIFHEE